MVGVADSLDALPTDSVDMVGTFRAQLDQLIAMQVRRRRRNTQETHADAFFFSSLAIDLAFLYYLQIRQRVMRILAGEGMLKTKHICQDRLGTYIPVR